MPTVSTASAHPPLRSLWQLCAGTLARGRLPRVPVFLPRVQLPPKARRKARGSFINSGSTTLHNTTPNPTLEQLLNDTDELLRCARATAYETADHQQGSTRDHAFAVVHLIDMARIKLDAALRVQQPTSA